MCDKVKGIVALCVLDIWICSMGYKHLDDIEVTIVGGPSHWGGNEAATEGVDFCTLF